MTKKTVVITYTISKPEGCAYRCNSTDYRSEGTLECKLTGKICDYKTSDNIWEYKIPPWCPLEDAE